MSSKKKQKTTRTTGTLRFEDGAVQFRQRLICSLLSHRPLLIKNIRSDDLEAPGLRDYEASFLRLLDTMTNGTNVEINNTGTQLRFKPGILLGGSIEHDCPLSRNVGWYIEGILPLAPFGKEALEITLTGITDGTSHVDPSPDYLAATTIPLMEKFGIGIDLEESPPPHIRVVARGSAPKGEGCVEFFCPIEKELQPLDFIEMGKFKRVRGTCVSTRIPPSSAARVAHSAKGLLHRLLPDVWIHTDVHSSKKNGCGPSPGLSLWMAAETTEGVQICSETCMDYQAQRGSDLPEDVGTRGAAMLLDEVRKGGCVDTSCQSLALLWMCLGPEDVARIRLGTLSRYTIASLRLYKDVFGVEFKIKPDHSDKTVVMSCLGTGFRNMAKKST